MHEFIIHLPAEQVEAMIRRDCYRFRRAWVYFWRDYRVVLTARGSRKGDWAERLVDPGVLFDRYRYFLFEVIPQGAQTTIRGKFTFSFYSK